jgi:2-polyprenyl-6-methoxyphenol hydroxylase-like FAD-dependent oxidoreductase
MNAGIQDAINLGWKRAFAPAATDPAALLDSYDMERRLVARPMLALTHLAFWAEASTSPLASLRRRVVAPLEAVHQGF